MGCTPEPSGMDKTGTQVETGMGKGGVGGGLAGSGLFRVPHTKCLYIFVLTLLVCVKW